VADDRHPLGHDEDAELAARRAEAIGQPVIVVGFENADAVHVSDVNTSYDEEHAAWQKLVEAQLTPEDFFSQDELAALEESGGLWATEPASGEQRAEWREKHPELLERFNEWTKRPLPPSPSSPVKYVGTVTRMRPSSVARPRSSGRAPRGRRVRTAAATSRDGPSSSDDGDDDPDHELDPAARGRVRVLLARLGRCLGGER